MPVMAASTPPPPAPLHLVLGEEELLVERAVQAVLAAARAGDPATELRRLRGAELTPGDLVESLSPSLFAEGRVVVVAGAHEIGKELAAAIIGYAADPADGMALVVLHQGGARGKPLADALRTAGAEVVVCEPIKWAEQRVDFVRAEVRRAGGRITGGAAAALVEAVRADLRELAAAAAQLVADTGGDVDEAGVRRYHRGRAESSGFAVADKAVAGDRAGALEELRWALAVGVAPVLVADALASVLRTLARVGSAGRGDPYRLAAELGMPGGRVKKAQAQVRAWRPESLATAFAAAAEVNADVKGVAADPGYALERAVLRICAARDGR